MIEFICPRCNSAYQADDRFAGRVVTCRSCGAKIDVTRTRAEPQRASKIDEAITAIQNVANTDTVSLTFIDEGHKKVSPDDTVVEMNADDLVPSARIPAADAPMPFGDPVKPVKEKKSKSKKKEGSQPIIFLDSETSPETVDAVLGPRSNLGSGARDLKSGRGPSDDFRQNEDARLDGISGIVLGTFGLVSILAIVRAFMLTGAGKPGFNAAAFVGQVLTCTFGLFLVLGPMVLLGVFITSRAMRFHLPGASYLRACAAAAAPATLVMLGLIFGAPDGMLVMLGLAGLAALVVMIHFTFAMHGDETVLAALASTILAGVGATAFMFTSIGMAEAMGVPTNFKAVAKVAPPPAPVIQRSSQPQKPTSIFDSSGMTIPQNGVTPRNINGGGTSTQSDHGGNDSGVDESASSAVLQPAPTAQKSWDLASDEHQLGGEEASFGPFKFELGDARLDLTDIGNPDRELRFLLGGDALTFEFIDVTDPNQQMPMIARSSAALESNESGKLFVIDATGKSKVDSGLINGVAFTRVEQDEGDVIYATRFDSGWLLARIDAGSHGDSLERVVRSVRYANDEPPASPLATEAIIRRLADSPDEAREILISRGRDIEDRLIQALRARNPLQTPGLIEVLYEVGSIRSYDVLFAIARDELDPNWPEARHALRKIAPDRFDSVTEAMLDVDSKDLDRRDEAVRQLMAATPDDRRRESVVKVLLRLTEQRNIDDIESELGVALAVWKTNAVTKHFTDLLDNEKSDRQQVRIGLSYLGRLREPAYMSRISRWTAKEPDAVRTALILAGPIAESECLAMLKQADIGVRKIAIDVLAEVGTQRSLATLEGLKNDSDLGPSAALAAEKIRGRK